MDAQPPPRRAVGPDCRVQVLLSSMGDTVPASPTATHGTVWSRNERLEPHQFPTPKSQQAPRQLPERSGQENRVPHSFWSLGPTSGHSTVPLCPPTSPTWIDSKVRTPFSQALRISRMAAEMLRHTSCHFICLPGGRWGFRHSYGAGELGWGFLPGLAGWARGWALTRASSRRSC